MDKPSSSHVERQRDPSPERPFRLLDVVRNSSTGCGVSYALLLGFWRPAYARDVNDGKCGLYHVRYRGRHYTLELRMAPDGSLYPAQVCGIRNAKAPQRLKDLIGDMREGEGRLPAGVRR
jgi:hypothetical protein